MDANVNNFPAAREAQENVAVHVVTSDPADREVLSDILDKSGCEVIWFGSVEEARPELGRKRGIVVCERELPDGTWHDLLALTSGLNGKAPVLVASRVADENLWAEVLNCGGFDVLTKPFDSREVSRAVQIAVQDQVNASAGR